MQGRNQQDASDIIFKKARLYLKTLETETCSHRNFLNQQNSHFVLLSIYGLPNKNLVCLLANTYIRQIKPSDLK